MVLVVGPPFAYSKISLQYNKIKSIRLQHIFKWWAPFYYLTLCFQVEGYPSNVEGESQNLRLINHHFTTLVVVGPLLYSWMLVGILGISHISSKIVFVPYFLDCFEFRYKYLDLICRLEG